MNCELRAEPRLRGLLKVCLRSVAKSRYGNGRKLSDICLTFVSGDGPNGGKGEHKLYTPVKTGKIVHPGVTLVDGGAFLNPIRRRDDVWRSTASVEIQCSLCTRCQTELNFTFTATSGSCCARNI